MLPTVFLPVMEGFQEDADLIAPPWKRRGGQSVSEELGDTLGSGDLGGTVGLASCFTVTWVPPPPSIMARQSSVTAVLRGGKLSAGLGLFV